MVDGMPELDAVIAAADLCERAGAMGFEVGHLFGDTGSWYAHATYRGLRLMSSVRRDPELACDELAARILRGGHCRCGKRSTVGRRDPESCRWERRGKRWEPGCDAPSMPMPAGARGNPAALHEAMRRATRGEGQ